MAFEGSKADDHFREAALSVQRKPRCHDSLSDHTQKCVSPQSRWAPLPAEAWTLRKGTRWSTAHTNDSYGGVSRRREIHTAQPQPLKFSNEKDAETLTDMTPYLHLILQMDC